MKNNLHLRCDGWLTDRFNTKFTEEFAENF